MLTFCDATKGFPAKLHLRNKYRNPIPMMHYYPDLGSTSDKLKEISHVAQPIRNTTYVDLGSDATSVGNFYAPQMSL